MRCTDLTTSPKPKLGSGLSPSAFFYKSFLLWCYKKFGAFSHLSRSCLNALVIQLSKTQAGFHLMTLGYMYCNADE